MCVCVCDLRGLSPIDEYIEKRDDFSTPPAQQRKRPKWDFKKWTKLREVEKKKLWKTPYILFFWCRAFTHRSQLSYPLAGKASLSRTAPVLKFERVCVCVLCRAKKSSRATQYLPRGCQSYDGCRGGSGEANSLSCQVFYMYKACARVSTFALAVVSLTPRQLEFIEPRKMGEFSGACLVNSEPLEFTLMSLKSAREGKRVFFIVKSIYMCDGKIEKARGRRKIFTLRCLRSEHFLQKKGKNHVMT